MQYLCEVESPEGMVQLLAASYLRHGYWWYVTGHVPETKSPARVDAKLIDKYSIDITSRERASRKKRGLANLHYARFQRWFIILASAGFHHFKDDERDQLRDCRRIPIKFEGYSISYRRGGKTPSGEVDAKWRSHVRIDKPTYLQLKAFLLDRAVHRSAENLKADFARVPYARYAPVRRQLLNLLRAVNAKRAKHNFQPLHHSVLRLRRTPVKVYADLDREEAEAA